jgi:hypothetical protein
MTSMCGKPGQPTGGKTHLASGRIAAKSDVFRSIVCESHPSINTSLDCGKYVRAVEGSVTVTDRGSSVEVATLLKARGWSIRILLFAAVGVLAAVLYNIWFTVGLVQVAPPTFAGVQGAPPTSVGLIGPGERATNFLLSGGYGPYLLPLVVLLLSGCFVLIIRPPLGAAGTVVWKTPSGRFAELQGELVGLAVLAGVVALGYTGVAVMGLAASPSPISVAGASAEVTFLQEPALGILATILASSAATLCLLGVLLTYWWILGVPRVTQEVEIPVLGSTPTDIAPRTSADDDGPPAIKS